MKTNTVHLGDCAEVMRSFPDKCVDSIVTDPSYGLVVSGAKDWEGDMPTQDAFQQMFRVIKPGGYLLCFSGTRTMHYVMAMIELAGFEIKDMMMWLYASGLPKSFNISKAIDKKLGKKRKVISRTTTVMKKQAYSGGGRFSPGEHVIEKTEAASQLAKDFDGYDAALKPSWEPIIVAMRPKEGSFFDNIQKYGLGGFNISQCRTEDGKWTPNVIHDGSEEVEAEMLDPNGRQVSRFFFCAKPTPKEKEQQGVENTHTTVKPIKLMQHLVRLTRPPHGGVVLDPYCGSGTTLAACILEDREYIGIEMDEEHHKITVDRLKTVKRKK